MFRELQLDGLVGPTHNYAGLSIGNVASTKHAGAVSNPREAALQGIEKMLAVRDLGIWQGVLPPVGRPILAGLRNLGFAGTTAQLLETAHKQAPELLACVFSASNMWVANAATISPSPDTEDGKLHFTPANLLSKFHRALEPESTTRYLRAIFHDTTHFTIHEPLPGALRFADEGAANHMRLCVDHGRSGIEIFVYGTWEDGAAELPRRFQARQHRESCEAIFRRHGVKNRVFLQQRPEAIDAGVFHNDVIAMSNRNLLIHHESAFVHMDGLAHLAEAQFKETKLRVREISASELTLEEAVSTYLFNSQLLDADGKTHLVTPLESAEHPRVAELLSQLRDEGLIDHVHALDVRQSMQNGGGPACLRLRVAMSEQQFAAMHQDVILTDTLAHELRSWIHRHYRDRLSLNDLRDPLLVEESQAALNDLETILNLPGLYPSLA